MYGFIECKWMAYQIVRGGYNTLVLVMPYVAVGKAVA